MNWWRAYHGIANDAKLALVARSRHVTPCHAKRCDVLAVWVALLDFASQNDPRGSIDGYDCEQIGWALEMEPTTVSAIIGGLRERRMIEGNFLTAWEKRQTKREREDTTAAARKQRQRARRISEIPATGREHAQAELAGADLAQAQQTGASVRAGDIDMTMFENGNVTPCHTMSPTEEIRGEEIEEREEREKRENQSAPQSAATRELLAALPKTWEQDPQFSVFAADYIGTGAALIAEDFRAAWLFCWKTLSLEQKLERIAALNRRSEEFHSDPRFVPKPQKFLEVEWKREPKPPRAAVQAIKPLNTREQAKAMQAAIDRRKHAAV